MFKICQTFLVAAGLALGSQSCFWDDAEDDEVDVIVPENQGTLTVRWTIDGQASAAQCADHGADFMELVVFDQFGAFASRSYAPCADFTTSILLPEGLWSVEVTLVNDAALAVTDRRRFDDVMIVRDEELVLSADFALDSFL
jgi:hypothetical protein